MQNTPRGYKKFEGTDRVMRQDFVDIVEALDADNTGQDTKLNNHKTGSILDHPDNSVTDTKIGNRTITDTVTAAAGAGTLTNLLSKIGNMIKRITGKPNWYTAPAITLEDTKNHIDAVAPHTGHAPTGYGLGEGTLTFLTDRDLNTVIIGGKYWVYTGCTNTPGIYGVLDVSMVNSGDGSQTLSLYNGKNYARTCSGGGWNVWRQIATMDLVAPAGYGLGANTKNVATTDINTIIVTGWYSGWGDTKTPSPNGGYTLRVESRNANFDHAIQEISHDAIPNIRWTRSCTSGVWSSWKQIATSDQIPTTPAQVGASASMISIPLTAGKWNLVIDGGAHTCFDFYYYHDISNGVFNVRGKFMSSNANAGYVLTYDSFSWVTANDLQIKIVDTGSIKKVYFKPYSNSNIVINPNYTSCTIHITPLFDIADNDTSGIYYSLKGSGSYINGKQIATTDITLIDRGNVPVDWNNATQPGVYLVNPDNPTGQTNTAIAALGLYAWGQVVVSSAGNYTSIHQAYYTHTGGIAVRQSFDGGRSWASWKQIATTNLIPAGAGAVKAHVNFSYEGGVITIRNSFNVSSVVRTSGGRYTINFATPLASANYTVQCTAVGLGTGVGQGLVVSEYMSAANVYGTKTINAIEILTVTNNDSDKTVADVGSCNVTILQ